MDILSIAAHTPWWIYVLLIYLVKIGADALKTHVGFVKTHSLTTTCSI